MALDPFFNRPRSEKSCETNRRPMAPHFLVHHSLLEYSPVLTDDDANANDKRQRRHAD